MRSTPRAFRRVRRACPSGFASRTSRSSTPPGTAPARPRRQELVGDRPAGPLVAVHGTDHEDPAAGGQVAHADERDRPAADRGAGQLAARRRTPRRPRAPAGARPRPAPSAARRPAPSRRPRGQREGERGDATPPPRRGRPCAASPPALRERRDDRLVDAGAVAGVGTTRSPSTPRAPRAASGRARARWRRARSVPTRAPTREVLARVARPRRTPRARSRAMRRWRRDRGGLRGALGHQVVDAHLLEVGQRVASAGARPLSTRRSPCVAVVAQQRVRLGRRRRGRGRGARPRGRRATARGARGARRRARAAARARRSRRSASWIVSVVVRHRTSPVSQCSSPSSHDARPGLEDEGPRAEQPRVLADLAPAAARDTARARRPRAGRPRPRARRAA